MIDFTNCRVIPGRAYNWANGSKDTVVDHRSAMMNTANNKVMRTDRVLTTYKKPTSPMLIRDIRDIA